jgi:hypothetical protein
LLSGLAILDYDLSVAKPNIVNTTEAFQDPSIKEEKACSNFGSCREPATGRDVEQRTHPNGFTW